MPETRRQIPIAEWEEGDRVEGYALVEHREVRQDRNGNDYLSIRLQDASGLITARAWSGSPALDSEFDAHDFVAFRGVVNSWRDQLQLKLDECRRVRPEDRRHGFDEAELIPTTSYDLDELWQRLERVCAERIRRPELRRLAAETLAVHGAELRVHPAAKSIHHAYRGGLLEHVVSMAELALAIGEHYSELDSDQLLIGVLFHDLGKLREIGAMPANEYTEEGRLVGHVVIGWDLLRERCAAIESFPAELQLRLEHLVLSHQGSREFGSPVVPATPEALALHFIDDLDAKLAMLRRAREQGGGVQYFRALERHVVLDALEAPGEDVTRATELPESVDEEDEEARDQPRLDL